MPIPGSLPMTHSVLDGHVLQIVTKLTPNIAAP